jgi:5-methylcytosine-specific restriction endonuclease McrA
MLRYWAKYPDAVVKRNESLKEYKFKNPENYAKQKDQQKQRWHSDEEYRLKQLEILKEKSRERYANPEYAEKRRLQGKEWFKNNAGLAKEKRARRRASEFNATPDWLTAIHKAQIAEYYEVATALEMQTGIKHHVDHIIPLKAKIASGLHVPWNLQVLTATENLRKHNSYEL